MSGIEPEEAQPLSVVWYYTDTDAPLFLVAHGQDEYDFELDTEG